MAISQPVHPRIFKEDNDPLKDSQNSLLQGQMKQAQSLWTDLKACGIRRDLQWGRKIHAKAVECHDDSNVYVSTALVKIYAKAGSMWDARCVFDSIQNPSMMAWNILLLGYVENGEGIVALNLFTRMKERGCPCEPGIFISALKACTSLAVNGDGSGKETYLARGRVIHLEIGCHLNHYVKCTLIDMYAKCESMVEAQRVFDSIQDPDVVPWTALLMGYAENGKGLVALEMFSRMKAQGCAPNAITYVAALKACISLAVNKAGDCLERGREIHSEIGCHMNRYVQCTLIDMYGKCGSMTDARHVFENIQNPNTVAWNVLLLGYADNGEGLVALDLFSKMKERGCAPDPVTYVAALRACTSLAANGDESCKGDYLERGRRIHLEIRFHLNRYLQSTLIYMYTKCGGMVEARRVFDSIKKPDVVSWTAMILGYAEQGEGLAALELFSRMKTRGCSPNSVTYVAALKACASLAVDGDVSGGLERGRVIHFEIGCHLNDYVQSTLVDMYAKCGSMVEARSIFDSIKEPDIVPWNALLLGYAENGEGRVSLDLFSRMKSHGFVPDSATFIAALKACTCIAVNGNGDTSDCLERGRKMHSEIGRHMNHFVRSTLMDMYAKCGSMDCAHRFFDSIQNPSVVCWNILILGYAENGNGVASLEVLSRMKACSCLPNSVTYIGALKACGLTGALALGRKLHFEISEFTSHVVTCLVDFYAKCGSMVEALEAFRSHSKARDVATWNALLAGYGNFDCDSVFKLFQAMQDEGFQPDAVTFLCILLCCSHAGLVQKAKMYFEAMSVQYRVTPTVVHYNCMVDVLGRANQLNEAIALLRKMPCNPNAITWREILSACRKWKNVEIGRLAFQSLVDIHKDSSAYVLMAHIYGSKGMWEEQETVLAKMSLHSVD